jgi:uncharacterized protein (TIGR03083 family)
MSTSLELIEHFSEDIALHGTLTNQQLVVPSCPEWTVGDLIYHLGWVQLFWAHNLLTRNSSEKSSLGEVEDPSDDTLAEWFRTCTATLSSALTEVGDDSPCWTWWGEPLTSGAVARHQMQEAAIHHWDVFLALGNPKALDKDVAHDGVGEFLEVHASEIPTSERPTVIFRSTDTQGTWNVPGDIATSTEIRGTASDLSLLLNGRIPLTALDVEGSVTSVQLLLDAIDLS